MQEILKGRHSILQLANILPQRGTKEVLFVTGQHLLQEGLFRQLQDALTIPCQFIQPPDGVLQTTAIPSFETLDAVVAIGGGKVLDYAKGIIYQHKKPVFFVAVPTTAGSGSEATPIAVFYSGKEKVSLDAPQLLPALAVLDEGLLTHLPAAQRAISGADALAQCIESAWNIHRTTLSESYAYAGLETLWNRLPGFVTNSDAGADEQVLWAAHLAGKAIALTRTTGPHALSYYLTAHHGVPHGQAVALTLPLFFLYNREGAPEQLQKMAGVFRVESGEAAFMACRDFLKSLGLATTLAELGLSDLDIANWLASVNQQRFANNPVPFDSGKLKALFLRYLC